MRHTRLAAGLDGLAQGNVPGIAKLIELGHTVNHDSGSAVPSQLHPVTVAAGYRSHPSTTRARYPSVTPLRASRCLRRCRRTAQNDASCDTHRHANKNHASGEDE